VQSGDVALDEEDPADVGNGRFSGAGRTWMVRVVTRPLPFSVAAQAVAASVAPGSALTASNKDRRFLLQSRMNSPPCSRVKFGVALHGMQGVGGDDRGPSTACESGTGSARRQRSGPPRSG
jgi:hypothetical protein